MKIKNYWDVQLEEFTKNKETRKGRKEKFLKQAKEIYPNLPTLTSEDYLRIKILLESGDESVLNELMEKSMQPIINSLAKIYAKYNIDEFVTIEEGISYVFCLFNRNLLKFKTLPRLRSEYEISTINFYVFDAITRCYQINKYRNINCDEMKNSDIIFEADKIEHEDFSYKYIVHKEVRKRIIEVMSKIDKREARIMALRFGLFEDKKTFEKIAELENISRARVEQLLDQGINHLRKKKNNKPIRIYLEGDLDLIN